MSSARPFLVLRSDPLCRGDLPVRRCPTMREAREMAARLNRRVQVAYGRPRPGKLVPLYFAERTG
jgi:hypothetical protein